MLTTAQLQTLKTYINSVPAWASLPNNEDAAFFIAAELNKPASPAFTVWRTSVPNEELGDAFNGTEVAGLSSLNMQRLQLLFDASRGTQNGARADRRSAFDSCFSGAGGQLTRAALAPVWRRLATVAEKLFATGTGSDATPATLVVEGEISRQEVFTARSL